MKKLLKIIAPVLILVVSIGVVQALSAAKPAPEKKEEARILVRNALNSIDFYGAERMIRINQLPVIWF